MTGLEAGATYHVRAYAINDAGTVYGEDVEFSTKSTPPSVTTLSAGNITSNSATINGSITSTGGSAIKEAGFIYSPEGGYPEYKVQTQVSSGSFSYQLTNLDPQTKYYVQAYATNNMGTTKGSTISFTTLSGLPVVSTVSASSVGSVRAVVTGKISSDGGFPITECGICYSSTNKKPTISDAVVTSSATSGQYNCELTNLTPSTKYYARAYAKNENGLEYDYTSINFTTTNGMPAIKISQQPTYSGNSATVYGLITSDGGANIVRYGVVISRTNSQPSIENNEGSIDEEGQPMTNDISYTFTSIPTATMFYYRFYVMNSIGKIAYSSSGYVIGN